MSQGDWSSISQEPVRKNSYTCAPGNDRRNAVKLNLEPTLRKGLKYLDDNAKETGAMDIRRLRSRRGAGFFGNLEDLANWTKMHGSRLVI